MYVEPSSERLAFPGLRNDNEALGQCMRCGFCTIQCPTFTLTGDERDSPRGRVRFALGILDGADAPSPEAVFHLDRCLSCLACSSACPYGVDHARLWDEAKAKIEHAGVRPVRELVWRRLISIVFTVPRLFRFALFWAKLGQLFRFLSPRGIRRLLDTAPKSRPLGKPLSGTRIFPPSGKRRARVAMLAGCVQQVIGPEIDAATASTLSRHGYEVVIPAGSGCCGAVPLHMGMPEDARKLARRNIVAWEELMDAGLEAIIVNASGCGSAVKDYGRLFEHDPEWRERAGRIVAITKDVTEFLSGIELNITRRSSNTAVALHLPCSMQHGQGIAKAPRRLLEDAGFVVYEPREGHMCCGAAGTYNIFNPSLADDLGRRKAKALLAREPLVVATANLGCQLHISRFADRPTVHVVELLNWATGGELPPALSKGQLE
jgi:glycolate oxidase iron-sulfur subunit